MTIRPQHSFPVSRRTSDATPSDFGLSLVVVGVMTALLALMVLGAQSMPDSASVGPRGGSSLSLLTNVSPVPDLGSPPPAATQQPGLPPAP